MAIKKLTELARGERAQIQSLTGSENICRRLRSMGVIENRSIRKVFDSPFGDPTCYESQGVLVAIRGEDGAKILVEDEPWD